MMYKRKIAKLQKPSLAMVKSAVLSSILCVVLCATMFAGCYQRACDGGMLPLPQVGQQELEAEVAKNTKHKIAQTLYADFDNNGENEAFVLTRKKFDRMQSKFILWYVTQGNAMKLRETNAFNGASIKLINGSNYKHVLFDVGHGSFNKTLIYGLVNGEPQPLFKHNTQGAEVVGEKVFISIKVYCIYDNAVKNWLGSDVVEYGVYFDEERKQYVQFDATKIDEQQFNQYANSTEVIQKINNWINPTYDKDGYKAKSVEFKYLLREDNTIDVNFIVTYKDKTKYKYHATVNIINDNELNVEFDIKPGNKKTMYTDFEVYDKYIKQLKKVFDYSNECVCYDIDGDGVEELITTGYMAYCVYTMKGGKLKLLNSTKYGAGKIRVYPNDGIVYFAGGHMGWYYESYCKISGSTSKVVAYKAYEYRPTKEDPDVFCESNYEYQLNGVAVSEQEYNAFVATMENKKVKKHKDFNWEKVKNHSEY